MTPQEAVLLTKYVRAMCPQQRFDEYTADAWYEILAPYSLDEARAAVIRHINAGNSFASVGEIVNEIRTARRARLAEANIIYDGDPDEAWPEYLRNTRALTQAAADGQLPPQRAKAAIESGRGIDATGKGQAILRAVGRHTLSRRPELAAPCPHCSAPAGRPCHDGRGGQRRDAHPSRIEASRRLAAGQTPVSREDLEREAQQRRAAAQAALDGLDPADYQPHDGFTPPTDHDPESYHS